MLSFLTPLTVRLVPEIIAWPYPTGFDSLMYTNALLRGYPFNMPPAQILKSASLFYVIASPVNYVIGDFLVTMKVLGAVIFAALCSLLYVYGVFALKWGRLKSLCVCLLAGSYFVSLGMSWQMYRMTLGVALLMATLTALRIERFKVRTLALSTLAILTVWAHEIAAVMLFLLFILNFAIGGFERKPICIAAAPSAALFFYQLYNPLSGSLNIPVGGFESPSWLASASFITGSLIYMFLPILPLIVLGARRIRHLDVWGWTAVCLFLAYMPFFLPQYSSLWYRWVLLLAYPAYFFAVEGLDALWMAGRRLYGRLSVGGLLATAILAVNFAMSAYYVACPPESQINYFGDWNAYKAFIPTSMLQNSVSISDTPSVVEAMEWVKANLNGEGTVLVLHEAMDNWAGIIIGDRMEIIRVNEANISSPIRINVAERLVEIASEKYAEGKAVYTVWWVDGKGWYNMPDLPHNFVEFKRFGNIGVFKYGGT